MRKMSQKWDNIFAGHLFVSEISNIHAVDNHLHKVIQYLQQKSPNLWGKRSGVFVKNSQNHKLPLKVNLDKLLF